MRPSALSVLSPSERQAILEAPRPRNALPLLESLGSRARRLPLLDAARDVDRRQRPVHAVWELTLRCDLACRHCGSRAGRARPDELGLDEALELVDQLADLGVKEVTLIGGEAYLFHGWTEVIRAVVARGMSCAMVSGGQGIDAAVARAAAEAGLGSLSISIDGEAASHDRLRGKAGAHRKALEALVHARSAGLPIAVNTQINRLNLHELDAVADLILREGCHGWQLQLTVPAGRAADEPDVLLQPEDLLVVFPILARLHTRLTERGIKFLPGNNIGYFGPFERQLRESLRCPSNASCSAGRSVIGIEANGDIKGCPSLPTVGWVGGNVRDHRLVDIWERAEPLRYTREHRPERLWGFCGTCYYKDHCRAGCTWTSAVLLGRPGNNPYCHHRALEHAKLGLRERIVQAAPAPGESFDHALWELIVEPAPVLEPSVTSPPNGGH